MSNVRLEKEGQFATLRLNNPSKLNAFTPEMLADLENHCRALEHESSVLAVIVAASPANAFCAGADIAAWQGIPAAEFARHWVREGHRVFDGLARLSKPTVAAIGAHAFGGGLELAAACDIRVMAPTATLGLPEAGIGIAPGWSGTQRLTRLVPESVLKEMALFGRRLEAERAHALGFVAEISENPEETAQSIAAVLSTTSPRATEVAKFMIHAAVDEDRSAMIEALGGGMAAFSDDKAEGVSAFMEKRKPVFSGK